MIELFKQFLEQYYNELALVSITTGFITAFVYLAFSDKHTDSIDTFLFTLLYGMIGFLIVWTFPISIPTIIIMYIALKIKKIRLNK